MPRVVGIVQARMGSTRLPGKVLMDLAGKPLLVHVLERVARTPSIDEVVLAIPDGPADESIAALAASLGFRCIAGSEQDVLSRYAKAARESRAGVVVRFTADCPLIDPGLSDEVVKTYFDSRADFASNCLDRSFPRGVETEVLSADLLYRLDREATLPHEREHVTIHLYEHRDVFRCASVVSDESLRRPGYRLCVDTAEDLQLVREVYARLGPGNTFSMAQAVRLLDETPALAAINAHIQQKQH